MSCRNAASRSTSCSIISALTSTSSMTRKMKRLSRSMYAPVQRRYGKARASTSSRGKAEGSKWCPFRAWPGCRGELKSVGSPEADHEQGSGSMDHGAPTDISSHPGVSARRRLSRTLGGLAAVFTLAIGLFIANVEGPYYGKSRFDPSYAYLFNALDIEQGVAPFLIQHPGTTVQLVGAAVLRVRWWIENRNLAPTSHRDKRLPSSGAISARDQRRPAVVHGRDDGSGNDAGPRTDGTNRPVPDRAVATAVFSFGARGNRAGSARTPRRPPGHGGYVAGDPWQ